MFIFYRKRRLPSRQCLIVWIILLFIFTPALSRALTRGEAAHLLSRAAFGGTCDEINRLLPLSREQAVDRILSQIHTIPRTPPPGPLPDGRSAAKPASFSSARACTTLERKHSWAGGVVLMVMISSTLLWITPARLSTLRKKCGQHSYRTYPILLK